MLEPQLGVSAKFVAVKLFPRKGYVQYAEMVESKSPDGVPCLTGLWGASDLTEAAHRHFCLRRVVFWQDDAATGWCALYRQGEAVETLWRAHGAGGEAIARQYPKPIGWELEVRVNDVVVSCDAYDDNGLHDLRASAMAKRAEFLGRASE